MFFNWTIVQGLQYAVIALLTLTLFYLGNVLYQLAYEASLYLYAGGMCFFIWIFRRSISELTPQSIFLISFFTSVVWGLYAETIAINDFGGFYNAASQFSKSGDLSSVVQIKSPPTVLYYAAIFWVFGDGPLSAILGASAAWSLQAVLVYLILDSIECSKVVSAACALVYSLIPGTLFFSTVVSSESVAILLVLAATYYAISLTVRIRGSICFFLGASSVFAVLARTQCLFLVLPLCIFVLTFLLFEKRLSKGKLLLFLAGVFVIAGAQLSANKLYKNELSILPSDAGPLVLMFGTNMEYSGRYNRSDLDAIGYHPPMSRDDRNNSLEKAASIAMGRISSAPLNFIRFSLTDKIPVLWNSTDSLVWSAHNGTSWNITHVEFWKRLCKAGTLALLILSVAGLLRLIFSLTRTDKRLANSSMIILAACAIGVLSIGALHLIYEVQGRYSFITYPFLILISGIALQSFSEKPNHELNASTE